jgi:MoxR-like ATPase
MSAPAVPTKLPPTDEHRLPTQEHEPAGRPLLLAVLPRSIAVRLPPLGGPAGRAWLAESGIADSEVSASHLRFRRAGGGLEVTDLGSRNGTWINRSKLVRDEPVALDDGAVVRIGNTLLVYREAFTGPDAPAPPIGRLVGPWGLGDVRAALSRLGDRARLNVLIEGESGTGKELVAEEIARLLGCERRYGRINVAALPPSVFDAQLFGSTRGSFTGSIDDNPGIIRAHAGGAVLLDEIGELPIELQPKLLRLLENREVVAVGSNTPVKVEIAILAATNQTLDLRVTSGHFRLDLLARFHTRIELPRLADRPEDVFEIFQALASGHRPAHSPGQLRADVEAVELMMVHDWPWNVRELASLVAATDPAVGLKEATVRRILKVSAATGATARKPPLTREVIEAALKNAGSQVQAAVHLGVNRAALLRRMKKLGI